MTSYMSKPEKMAKSVLDHKFFRNIRFSSRLWQKFFRMNSKTWKTKFGIKNKKNKKQKTKNKNKTKQNKQRKKALLFLV